MRNLALINRDDHDKEAHTETSNRPTAIQPLNGLRGRLKTSADDENEAPNENCPFTSDIVTNGSGEAGTEEGSSREERNCYTTGDLMDCSAFCDFIQLGNAGFLTTLVKNRFCLRLNVCWTVEVGFEGIASNHFCYNTKIISI